MRRLLRWTFNALAATSLLLCLATAALGVRSYWVGDELYAHRPEASDRSHGRVQLSQAQRLLTNQTTQSWSS